MEYLIHNNDLFSEHGIILKECPFCGNQTGLFGFVQTKHVGFKKNNYTSRIICYGCGCKGPMNSHTDKSKSIKNAILKFNERSYKENINGKNSDNGCI